MTVTKQVVTSTIPQSVYTQRNSIPKWGLKEITLLNAIKQERRPKAELEILTKIHQLENGEISYFLKLAIFFSLSSLIIFGGIHTKLVNNFNN